MYLITMELLGPSVPPVLGPCELSPPNSYLKHTAVYPKHIPPGVESRNRFCHCKNNHTDGPLLRLSRLTVLVFLGSAADNANCFYRLQIMSVLLYVLWIF